MGSSVRKDPNAYLKDLIDDLQSRVKELEENALTSWDIVAETLQMGEPTTTPKGIGDASLAGNFDAEGYFNIGTPTTPASAAGNGVISGNLDVEGTITGTGTVTGGDSHDHDGGDGGAIPEAGLAAAVSTQLVTSGDSHDHTGGAGAAIDTDALAAGAVTNPKLGAQSVDTAELANLAVGTAKIAADAVDDTKAGDRVPQFYRRKGGSSSNWSTQGTTTYTPTAVRIQAGVMSVTINDGNNTGNQTISFPQSFGGAPVVVCSMIGSSGIQWCSVSSVSSSGCTLTLRRTGTSGATSKDIAWIAIGSEN